jgi:hypothetical protein
MMAKREKSAAAVRQMKAEATVKVGRENEEWMGGGGGEFPYWGMAQTVVYLKAPSTNAAEKEVPTAKKQQ